MADVVPLRRRGAPEFSGPARCFVDAAEPDRALTATWAPDQQAVQISIEGPDGGICALVLGAEDVLHLVRALVEGLPLPAAGEPRPLAAVLPLRRRQSGHGVTDAP